MSQLLPEKLSQPRSNGKKEPKVEKGNEEKEKPSTCLKNKFFYSTGNLCSDVNTMGMKARRTAR